MYYSEFINLYESLAATAKRLGKTTLIANFLKKLKSKPEYIYLLRGRVFPDYDPKEFGISGQLTIKALGKASGISSENILKEFRKIGDLGEIAEKLMEKREQSSLFRSRLSVDKVFSNLRKLAEISGSGSVDKKMDLILEILNSASGKEAKYIVRTLLSDLRVGIADATLVDAIAESTNPELAKEIENAYNLANDSALVFQAAQKGKPLLEQIEITPDKPTQVMLAPKVSSVQEAFEVCGKPAAFEHKYDGFRMLVNKNKNHYALFTRRLENVTNQFPDVIEAIKKHVKGDSFILDSEIIGYNPKTKRYMPFEAISQRIKRKYEIEKLISQLPVEAKIFDILYYNGKTLINHPFIERRKIIEKIISPEKLKIYPATQLITSDEQAAENFYKTALKSGQEGVMIKNLKAPYQAGRRVGYMVKLKPELRDFDLAIVGAEYGSGKRAGWLTSYIVACRKDGQFLEIGKVSSGLKEKTGGDTTYEEMTQLLKPLIIEEHGKVVRVKPKVVVSVNYQNIQPSPEYTSGYAMRFPRITRYRPDRGVLDIASLDEIEKEIKNKVYKNH